MKNTSDRRAAGIIIVVVGVGLIASAPGGGSPTLGLLGLIVIWVGFAVRGASKKRAAPPRVPPGFAVRYAERVEGAREPGEQQPPGPLPQEFGESPTPQPPFSAPLFRQPGATTVPPAPWPSMPAANGPTTPPVDPQTDSDASSGTPSPGVAPDSPASDAVTVPRMVRAQVVELAQAGRTVEAIDVLREATGMELYEASQYVRKARQSPS